MTTTKAPLPELLPCPFCANEKPFATSYIHSHQFACVVVCGKDNCGSSGTWYSRESEDAAKNVAYKAWNTRARERLLIAERISMRKAMRRVMHEVKSCLPGCEIVALASIKEIVSNQLRSKKR